MSTVLLMLLMSIAINFHAIDALETDTKEVKNMSSSVSSDSIYNFQVTTISGNDTDLSEYKGKWMLIVNTASECGFTPQFEGLEQIYQDYKDKDVVVLGFPCNQFGGQEPGDEESIKQGCMVNYGVTFPMFSKIDVNGDDAHPLFVYLKSKKKGLLGSRIKWNFTKFLVDPTGKPIKRYGPTDTPEKIEKDIKQYLADA